LGRYKASLRAFMAIDSRFYRNTLIKLSVGSIAFIGIFWDVLQERRKDSPAFLAGLTVATIAANLALFIAMRRASERESAVAHEMQRLEVVAGRSEADILEDLLRIGSCIDTALAAVPPPFKVASDAKGFSLIPFGVVRVVEIEGSGTLSRIVAKEGAIIQRRTMAL
jgi:hypothetical protein